MTTDRLLTPHEHSQGIEPLQIQFNEAVTRILPLLYWLHFSWCVLLSCLTPDVSRLERRLV